MKVVRDLLTADSILLMVSTYDDRPSKLFDGMHHARIAVLLAKRALTPAICQLFVTGYNKWYRDERGILFAKLSYTQAAYSDALQCFPKIRCDTEAAIIGKLISLKSRFTEWLAPQPTDQRLYYKITGVGHWFTITLRPPRFMRGSVESSSTREESLAFPDAETKCRAFAVLNSSLFYWFYQVRTNCRDFNPLDYR